MVNTSIPYGINEIGKEIYIDEVPNGKECNCICPECHKPLIAKNGGEIKIHHFAHSNKSDGATCFQTLLHRFAKDIFKEGQNSSFVTELKPSKNHGIASSTK